MVHSGIFATSSEILTCAGENYDTGVTEAKINELCLQAESVINAMSSFNWTDEWTAGLNADVKYILSAAEANWVAFHIIKFNTSGYASRLEAETMMDGCWDMFQECMKILKDKEYQTFIKEA